MCQVTDGEPEDMQKKPSLGTGKDCMKCGGKAVVIARIKDPLCRECFLTYFTHKFRSTIGKSRLIRDGDKVLVAISGGHNSCCMLNLIKRGVGVTAQKKLRFVPALVYLDEGAVLSQSREERLTNQKAVCKYLEESGFPWYTMSLEEVFDARGSTTQSGPSPSGCHDNASNLSQDAIGDRLDGLKIDDGKTERLETLFAQTKSLTAKEDLVQRLRRELLLHLARQHGYDKVMLGNTSTSLSACILTNIANGRGAAVPLDMGFSDNRHGDIMFVRPMRELTNREVALYNRLFSVESSFIPNLSTKAGEYSSINRLTEAFVNGLQDNFPSTVSTVFRTGEKLTSASDDGSTKDKCAICAAQIDSNNTSSSALSAAQYTIELMKSEAAKSNQQASQSDLDGSVSSPGCEDLNSPGCCGKGDGSCGSKSKGELPTREQIELRLCYGCRLTVKDMSDISLLPSYILEEVARQERRAHMRDEIHDFLLDES